MKRIGLVPEKDLRYGIVVDTQDGLKWVTEIACKVAEWGEGDAYTCTEREEMERICMGLCVHGTPAFVVVVPPYITGMGN